MLAFNLGSNRLSHSESNDRLRQKEEAMSKHASCCVAFVNLDRLVDRLTMVAAKLMI